MEMKSIKTKAKMFEGNIWCNTEKLDMVDEYWMNSRKISLFFYSDVPELEPGLNDFFQAMGSL